MTSNLLKYTEPGREKGEYYIGKVAEITGATRKAIRLYEAQGLLPKPKRRGNYRVYTDKDVFLIHVVKHAQAHGFTLNELRELIYAIAHEKHFPVQVALQIVEKKREAVLAEAKALYALGQRLVELMENIKMHFE